MGEVGKQKAVEGRESPITQGIRFLKEVRVEAKKITWAGKRQVLMSSLMVILFSLFIGAYLGLLDIIYNFLISLLVK